MLDIKGVKKSYGEFQLDCSLNVEKGRITGLVGENGAGKSTVFKAVLGLISYDGGEIKILGKDNSCSLKRKEDPSAAYFQCHTDITVPYEELEEISVVTKDGKHIILIKDGRFVLPGTEILNEPLKQLEN